MTETRRLNDWLDNYVHYCHDSEPPLKFHEWMGISVISAALQRKCRLQWGSLTFFPNFYIVLVAPAGQARKGTAMNMATDIISDLSIPLAPDASSLQALIRYMSECTRTEENIENGYFDTHSSLTAFAPELTVFLGYSNKELVTNLCDMYDCRKSFKYDTIGRGSEEITGVFLNLVGATTPDLIKSSMPVDTIGSGLPSRMIFVYERNIRYRVICPFFTLTEEGKKLKQDLLHDLVQIRSTMGDFKVSNDFLDKWTEWYGGYPPTCPFDPYHFGGYWERRPAHVMKLSMIMSISRSNNKIIREKDLTRAINLIEETEIKMAETFRGIGQSSQAEVITQIMNFISKNKKVSSKELMSNFIMHVSELEMDRILSSLRASDFIYAPTIKMGVTYIEHKQS